MVMVMFKMWQSPIDALLQSMMGEQARMVAEVRAALASNQREAEVLRARLEELLGASNAREGEGLEVEQEEVIQLAGSPVTLPLDVSTQAHAKIWSGLTTSRMCQFPPSHGYPPIQHRSLQKTSTSKSDLRFSRKKKRKKDEKNS